MKKYIIALILIVLVFNGFSNLREITDLAIVRAIGIDIDENGDYIANVTVLDTSKKDNTESIVYEAKGPSVQDAIRNIVDKSPKRLYLAHMETLIISEKIAREKLEETLDFFIRDNEGSNKFFLIISKECDAKEAIEVLTKEKISMKDVLMSSSKYKGNGNTKTLNGNIKDILSFGKDICVNTCMIEDEKIVIGNMAYFKDWNMKGYLTEDESITYNLLENNINNAIITIGEDENLIVSELINCKSKIQYLKGEVVISVKADLNISETGKNIKLNEIDEVENVSRKIEEEIKSKIEELIVKSKGQYDADILGFGNLAYRKKVDNVQNVKVNVKVEISNQGGVMKKW